jgi:hypothetical protein
MNWIIDIFRATLHASFTIHGISQAWAQEKQILAPRELVPLLLNIR